ncbi:MAG: DUF3375 domain-containing protein [Filimonas sp.]|nr:DUF3375 domain-containing protein [Filimonas sp.]
MATMDVFSLFNNAPAIQMLRMRNAAWVLPFLYEVFKEGNNFSVEETKLTHLLAETLSLHADGLEDLEEAKIEFGEDEESRARKYLLNWVQKRVLQDFPDSDGTTQYQLSAHTEKVFQWFQTLARRDFVGTESRFKMLFSSLRDMVEKSEDDRTMRLEELKNKRAAIDREIKALELGATVEVYNNAQVQERLELFIRLCYELLSDFREVEDNFKQIHRSIVEHHTKAELNKGAIVGYAFEAYDSLRNSDQGKSFYAFWDFLISRAGQEEWRLLTEQLFKLLEDRNITADNTFLQNIKTLLLQQGRNVYEANDRMAEKLSRIISEKEIARHRRLRTQISNIKELVLDAINDDTINCGIGTDKAPEIRLAMDRKLNLEQKAQAVVMKQPANASEAIADMERFSRMLNTSFIDKKKLWQKVEDVLKQKQTATLKEIAETAGLEHGIPEIVSYFSFLKDKASRVQALSGMTEHIAINEAETKFIEVPYLLFSK